MKQRLIYIYPADSPFTRKDIDFLSKRYDIITIQQEWLKNNKILINLIRQFFFLLKVMPKSAAAIIMFGSYWSLLPALLGKIFNKPVFIILGGSDCVSFPEYNYGCLRKPFLKKILHWSYSLAERLLPVDESLVFSDYIYDRSVRERKQGFQYFFPRLKTPYTVINNGFDLNYWQPPIFEKNPWIFTTVAAVDEQSRYQIKGIDIVIKIAWIFPEYRFNIIGMDMTFAKSLGELPSNIIIHDFLKPEIIINILHESRYYLQLSISEGFPNALCEAMLCECIPICSNVGGMPFIVKDSGVIIENRNIDIIVHQVRKIINSNPEDLKLMGKKARKSIVSRFSIENRENAFLEILGHTTKR